MEVKELNSAIVTLSKEEAYALRKTRMILANLITISEKTADHEIVGEGPDNFETLYCSELKKMDAMLGFLIFYGTHEDYNGMLLK